MAETRKHALWREVTDELQAIAVPLIPELKRLARKKYGRKAGGGRKPLEPRPVFEGIAFVRRTAASSGRRCRSKTGKNIIYGQVLRLICRVE
jgi:hypothetical protein